MKLQFQDNDILCGFGIVVFDKEDSSIEKTIESLKKINYHKKAYKIIISSKYSKKSSSLFHYINQFKSNEILSEVLIVLEDCINIEKEAYSKCVGATHLVKIEAGDTIDPDLFLTINKIVASDNDYKTFEKDNIKIINFASINDIYLNFGSFDLSFDFLKNSTKHKDLNEK